jgi:MFS transporter, OFA family, oxalate/formate antiporter
VGVALGRYRPANGDSHYVSSPGGGFLLLSRAESFETLTALAFLILLCYGGGFGTMPAFAADFFCAKDVGLIYGAMLTAWGAAALFGPTLVARLRESTGHYQGSLRIIAIVMLLSAILPLFLRTPNLGSEKSITEDACDHAMH